MKTIYSWCKQCAYFTDCYPQDEGCYPGPYLLEPTCGNGPKLRPGNLVRTRGKPIPPEARAALISWNPGGITLNDLARSLGVNLSSTRTLRWRARQQREGKAKRGNEARRPDHCGVEVICSPGGQFSIGNKFTMIDLEFMIKLSGMPDGTAFRVTPRGGEPYTAEMRGGKLVRVG